MQEIDEDGSGEVEFGEFQAWWVDHGEVPIEQQLKAMWDEYDADGSGLLSGGEIRGVLRAMGKDVSNEGERPPGAGGRGSPRGASDAGGGGRVRGGDAGDRRGWQRRGRIRGVSDLVGLQRPHWRAGPTPQCHSKK
jgi:hypothetical protein